MSAPLQASNLPEISTYYIDVVGSCNLRCPSCPIGNSRGTDRPVGIMSERMFEDIIMKVRRESPSVDLLWLFNWTEPVLHPRLPGLIEIAREHGFRVCLSSNLNAGKNFDQVMAAEPNLWIVSLSGFSQDIYSLGHTKGDIEVVKENMRRLSELRHRYGDKTDVSISYHCYNDNLGVEYDNMRAFCASLDLACVPTLAYFYPLEKLFDYFDGTLSVEDHALVDRLIVSPAEASEIALANPSEDCVLRSNMMSINCDGSVSLCCTVFDKKYGIADSYLEIPLAELQARKYRHETCKSCMSKGLHDAFTYQPLNEWRARAEGNLPGVTLPEGLLLQE
jgi:hypothetical protein